MKYRESWSSWTVGLLLVFGLRYIMMHADDFENEKPRVTQVTPDMTSEELIMLTERLLRLSEDAASRRTRDDPDHVRVSQDGPVPCSPPGTDGSELRGSDRPGGVCESGMLSVAP